MGEAKNETGTAVLEPQLGREVDTRTILLLDPVTLFLRFEETILHRREWRILTARTGRQALSVLEREHVDLLIMDHALPDMAGEDLVASIRKAPRTRATSILVLTARGAEGQVERCLENGANGVAFKPVSRQILCARAEDLLHVAARRHVRTLVRVTVDGSHDGRSFFGNTVNVSAGGMLLQTGLDIPLGATLDVRFALPGDAAPIAVRARVVRVGQGGVEEGVAHGLIFEGLSDTERERIDRFVGSRRAEQGC